MRWATQIVVGVAISFALVRPGFAQTASSCAGSDAERSIVACTFVIDAGLAKPDDVAIAYYNRGNAYAATASNASVRMTAFAAFPTRARCERSDPELVTSCVTIRWFSVSTATCTL